MADDDAAAVDEVAELHVGLRAVEEAVARRGGLEVLRRDAREARRVVDDALRGQHVVVEDDLLVEPHRGEARERLPAHGRRHARAVRAHRRLRRLHRDELGVQRHDLARPRQLVRAHRRRARGAVPPLRQARRLTRLERVNYTFPSLEEEKKIGYTIRYTFRPRSPRESARE